MTDTFCLLNRIGDIPKPLERQRGGREHAALPSYTSVFHIVRTLSAEAGFLEQCTTKEKSFESLRVATSHTLGVPSQRRRRMLRGTYCVKKPFGVQQFSPLSTTMPSLSLVTISFGNKYNFEATNMLNPTSASTSYPSNSPKMPMIDTTSSPSLSINGTKETPAERTCCCR